MPTFTRTVSAADAQRLVDAYCATFIYQDQIIDPAGNGMDVIPNPESRAQFTERMITEHAFKRIVRSYEERVAKKAADDAINIVDIDVT